MIQQIDRRIVRPVVTLPDDVQRAYEPSRLFDDANSTYLGVGSARLTAPPFTMASWFYSDNLTVDQTLIAIGDTSDNYYFALMARGTVANDPVCGLASQAGVASAVTTTSYSVNVWHHGLYEEIASNSRAVRIDDGSEGTNATDRTPTGLDNTTVGVLRYNNTFYGYMSGSIFWPCIWNTFLDAGEKSALANRSNPTPPWEIRPKSIVSMPNMRTLWDPYMKARWTPTGTRPANPPWLWTPRTQVSMYVPVAGFARPKVRGSLAHGRQGLVAA